MVSPFVHRFQSLGGNFYIYDVHTNKIFRVNKIVYEIIDDFLRLSPAQIVLKWQNKYAPSEIINAIKSINARHEKGFISEHRPRKMVMPYTDEEINESLATKINQLILNITERCNLRCKYCSYSGTYRYELTHSNRIMRNDVIEKALLYFAKRSMNADGPAVSFYGGEALLAFKKIVRAIKFLKSLNHNRNYDIIIDSNGVALNKTIIDFITKNNIRLQISVDGPRHIHDKYRVDVNGRPTFERIIKNLNLLRNRNGKSYDSVTFACTVCPSQNLLEINDFFENNGWVKDHTLSVNSVDPFDTTFYESFSEDEYARYISQIDELRKRYMDARMNDREPTNFEKMFFEKNLGTIHRRYYGRLGDLIGLNGCCLPGVRKLFVTVDGEFQPCERVGQACHIGDVNNGIKVSQIKKMMNEYIELSEKQCLNCWGLRLCGVCFSFARKGYQFDADRKKEQCRRKLKELHSELVIYSTIMEKNPKAFDFAKDIIIK